MAMSEHLTPEQEARVREIVQEELAQAAEAAPQQNQRELEQLRQAAPDPRMSKGL